MTATPLEPRPSQSRRRGSSRGGTRGTAPSGWPVPGGPGAAAVAACARRGRCDPGLPRAQPVFGRANHGRAAPVAICNNGLALRAPTSTYCWRRSPCRGSPTGRWAPPSCSSARPSSSRRTSPRILDGSTCWAIGMSEPDAGSNVAGIRTRAVRDGRRLPRQRPEDLDLRRRLRRLHLPHLPHRPRRPGPRRAVRAHRRPALPRASPSCRSRT